MCIKQELKLCYCLHVCDFKQAKVKEDFNLEHFQCTHGSSYSRQLFSKVRCVLLL
jgi:hypothetical protein